MDELDQRRKLETRVAELEARMAAIEATLFPKDERTAQERLTGIGLKMPDPVEVHAPQHGMSLQEKYTGIPIRGDEHGNKRSN